MKQRNVKRFLSLLLVGIMLIASLGGCGDKDKDKDPDVGNVDPNGDEEPGEPITITVGTNSLGNGFPEDPADDFVRQEILKATNVDLELIYIDDYYTALNVQLTGGNAPDFFYADRQNIKSYAAQGLIRDITDFKDELDPVFDYIGEEWDNYNLYVDDVMYAFPKAESITNNYYDIYIRQDFLDKFEMKMPTTVDELYDFCTKAVKENAAGLDATIGLGGTKFYPYNIIAGTYGVALGNYLTIVDGKVSNVILDEHMKDALTAAKKFYDAGVVSANTFDGGNGIVEMRKAQVACGSIAWSGLFKQAYQDVFHEVCPDGEWSFMDPLESNVKGVTSVCGVIDYNENAGEKIVVNDNTSDEKVKAFIKVLNYLSGDEGKMVSWIGVEGTHWDYDSTGKAVIREDQATVVNYVHMYQFIGRNDAEYLDVKFPEANEAVAHAAAMEKLQIYNNCIEVPETFYYDDLKNYVETQLLAFIKGDRKIDEYDTFVQEVYNSYGLQEYLDIASEQLKELGLIK